MRYIYMNNFRGFSKTLVPLKKMNFLVGENSTGKSSFLNLLSTIYNPNFWIAPNISMKDDTFFSSFSDFVSAWSNDKTFFQIGILEINKTKSEKIQLSFYVHEFSELADSPRLTRYYTLISKQLTIISFKQKKVAYKKSNFINQFDTVEETLSKFKEKIDDLKIDDADFSYLPREISENLPLPVVMGFIKNIKTTKSNETPSATSLTIKIPIDKPVKWIAPIRTKPRRIYDGIRGSYSPEGEHTPSVLKEALTSQTTRSKRFSERLKEFGKASGLFETIVAHQFGKGNKNPFELIVKFKGAKLNINNVGYGVSQALPLIVEFINTEGPRIFAVQQPEVHLHPRAQAALGGLLFEITHEQKHSFYIETHSDYLIDRYRTAMRSESAPPDSQILFFLRTHQGNEVFPLEISSRGTYPVEQPKEFRDFFIKEEMQLLGI